MEEKNNYLKPEDYREPTCLLCDLPEGIGEPKVMIPQQRISAKIDELMGKKDFAGTERLLKYWLDEAVRGNDDHGKFMIFNEMMGFYRQTGRKQEAYQAVANAISMIAPLGYHDTVSGATCFVNAGTVYCAFDEPEKGIEYFEEAQKIYEEKFPDGDYKVGGLYNNMALTLTSLKRFDEAISCYNRAIDIMKNVEASQLEQAISYLNIVDCLLSRDGTDNADTLIQIDELLHKAKDLIDCQEVERDQYYSYVVEKCIDIYDYFGWFGYAGQLRERVEKINAGNGNM